MGASQFLFCLLSAHFQCKVFANIVGMGSHLPLREFFYVLVMNPTSIFGRYGEQFILVGPLLEGFVGALSSFNGIVHA